MCVVYEIREVFHWTREGHSSRAIHCVEHEGFEMTSCGYRIQRNGKTLFSSRPPFPTIEAARAQLLELA